MATADLITAFLNNEMSPENERGFLLTVASSDTLRLELKSHVMLDRMFVAQSERAEVPEAIRGVIFAEAGIPIDGARPADAAASAGALDAGRRLSRSFMSRIVRGGLMVLLASSGFAAGYFSGQSETPVANQVPAATVPSSTEIGVAPVETSTSLPSSSPAVIENSGPADDASAVSPSRQPASTVSTDTRTVRATAPASTRRSEPAATSVGNPPSSPQPVTTPAVEPVQSSGTPPAATVDVNVQKPDRTQPTQPNKEEEHRMP